MEKCLVTGGAGFIGSNLVDKLIENGYEVVVIDNLVTGKKDYINPRAKFYNVDITSADEVESVFNQESVKTSIDCVFHFAAQIDVYASVENPFFDNKVNLFGGINILESCRKNKVRKMIFASTGGAVYGDTEEIPTTEDTEPNPLSPYGIHKLAFEKYLNYYYKVYAHPYCILRLANVYGPRQYKGGETGVITNFIDNTVNNRQSILYGDGNQTRDFVYVDDVVKAFIKGAKQDNIGVFNISTGVETRILDIINIIETVTEEKMNLCCKNFKPGEQQRSCLNFSRAEQILRWTPHTELTKGIRKTLDWSRNQKISNNQEFNEVYKQ